MSLVARGYGASNPSTDFLSQATKKLKKLEQDYEFK
jgi:hypothetical protein